MELKKLMEHISIIPDYRQAWKVEHKLSDILMLTRYISSLFKINTLTFRIRWLIRYVVKIKLLKYNIVNIGILISAKNIFCRE